MPGEGGAQAGVAINHLMPCTLKHWTLNLSANIVALLHEIDSRSRLAETMEEYPLLHWGQWIHIFDPALTAQQFVELPLLQPRQRKVGWRNPGRHIGARECDQAAERGEVVFGQSFDGRSTVQIRTETPGELELASGHLSIDLEEISSHFLLPLALTPVFSCRRKLLFLTQSSIELSEIIEDDFSLWQRAHALRYL